MFYMLMQNYHNLFVLAINALLHQCGFCPNGKTLFSRVESMKQLFTKFSIIYYWPSLKNRTCHFHNENFSSFDTQVVFHCWKLQFLINFSFFFFRKHTSLDLFHNFLASSHNFIQFVKLSIFYNEVYIFVSVTDESETILPLLWELCRLFFSMTASSMIRLNWNMTLNTVVEIRCFFREVFILCISVSCI